ncbi:MAG: class I SAM-dependent rRNA methyltransferase [Verrucomicrobiae bacterium]|nr:class I SAM-dependent rRNA methyltransferase [Verrucomicrobiae bacterium]
MNLPHIIAQPVRGSRFWNGHPWLYQGEIKWRPEDLPDGAVVIIKDVRARPLGTGLYNSKSQIAVRRFTTEIHMLGEKWITQSLHRALALRSRLWNPLPECHRVVFSESDGLPGLIIDRYGQALVVQTLTRAMDDRKALITEILQKTLSPDLIVERNDSSSRLAEGLETKTGILAGTGPSRRVVTLNGVRFELDFLDAQKTGLYLDQQAAYRQAMPYFKGREVLDCFTYHGAFALHAALSGASRVEGVDVSGPAIQQAEQNAKLNGAAIRFVESNAFDFLREASDRGRQFDAIILDPPSFTKNKFKVSEASKGYKEIHLRALKMLRPGGILMTFTCSHHVNFEMLRDIVVEAASDTRRPLRLREYCFQSPDHPILPEVPESEYLRGFIFEVR